ncbi:hypothetical protein [Rhizobium halophilum]|uniref:hypothetical protein n=1 Tax=Rhizobium halophilum TaxID=2846852 RepID=UPI001EFD4B16|nr:hypothetical protein [Rhizobium halophilum]MCF6369878.1 hypothetical protein [Rhizobium halophilum]
MRQYLLFALLPLALTGCQTVTPEERRAADQRTCLGYGFKAGTDAMARCLLDLDLERRADARSWRDQSTPAMWAPMYVERRIIIRKDD